MNTHNNVFAHWSQGYSLKEHITNPNIIVGDYTYYSGYYHERHFEEYCVRYLSSERTDVDKLVVGKFCAIGSGATFLMAGNQGHRYDWATIYPFFYCGEIWGETAKDGFVRAGDTIVGNDVWIGTEAMIMPGIKIGDGAVIGTRAVVTKDVEPYTIVGGNPAKPIKKRFSEEQITMLLEIKWWDWSEERIKKHMDSMCSGDIEKLYHIAKSGE